MSPPADADEHFRVAFESAPTGMAITDLDGFLVSVNAALCQSLGYSEEELVGRSVAAITHPDDRGIERPHAERVLAGEIDRYQVEKRFVRKNGEPLEALVAVSVVRDADGRPERVIGQVLDLTELHTLQRKLHFAQRMESLGRLAGGVAHDFNNLLTVIDAHVHMLSMRLGAEAEKDLRGIGSATERATRLTAQLLTFSRGRVMNPHPVDVNEVVRGMATMLERLLSEDIELYSSLDPRPAWVSADTTRLEQIVMNLVINARDAIRDGGSIEILTRRVTVSSDDADSELEPGEYVELAVVDDGHGMDASTRAQAMEPFFTTKDAGEGTGLGLATIYGVVHQLSGSIAIESEAGQGATVRIRLPRLARATIRDVSAPERKRRTRVRGTVLFVEDELSLREVMAAALRDAGHTVLEARNGNMALDILATGRQVDLIVTDVIMPELGGAELVERVLGSHPEMKVIFISGYADDAGSVSELARDHTFLHKPFSPEHLIEAIADELSPD